MEDITLTVGTTADISSAIETGKKLATSIDDKLKLTNNLKLTSQLESLRRTTDKNKEAMLSVIEAMEELNGKEVKTSQYKALEEELDKIHIKFEELNQRRNAIIETEMKKSAYDIFTPETKEFLAFDHLRNTDKSFVKLEKEIDTAGEKVDELINKLRALRETGKDTQLGQDSTEYAGYGNQLLDLIDKTSLADLKLSEYIGKQQTGVSVTDLLSNSVKKLSSNLVRLARSILRSGLSRLKSLLSSVGKNSDSAANSVRRLVRTFIKYGFGVRSFYFLFRKVRTALVDAIKTMGEFDETGLGASLNSLSDSLTYLKNAWAAAFAPIIEYVAPALITLMDILADVANAIAAMFATLTGRGTVVKAIKQQKALAGAIGGTGSAADDAKGKLAAFDKLNIIGTDDNGGSGGGGGSGSGDGDPGFIVETIEGELTDLVKLDKWFEIGQLFADRLNVLTESADNWLNDVFRPWGVKWATNIGNLMNGFIYHYNWELLGKTFADLLNSVMDTANTWLTTVHWQLLGTRVGDSIISMIDNLDVVLLGETIANYFNKAIDYFAGLVSSVFSATGAKKVGTAIADGFTTFFTTIHWDNLFSIVTTGISGIIRSLETFIRQFDWDRVGDSFANSFNSAIQRIDAKKAGSTISEFITRALDQLDKIDLFALGEKIGGFLASIDWANILLTALKSIGEILLGIVKGAFEGEYGASLAGLIAGALGIQLAGAFAKIEMTKLLGTSMLTNALSSLGVGSAGAAGAGAATAATGAGTGGVLAGLGGASAVGLAGVIGTYVIALMQGVEWLRNYNDALFHVDETTQQHIDELGELITQTDLHHEASLRQMDVYEQENDRARTLGDSYLALIDENGQIKEGMENRANYYFTQLAQSLGLEESQLQDLATANGGLQQAIDAVIQSKTYDRAVSAYLDEYQFALDHVKEAQDKVTLAEEDHKRALENAKTAQENYDSVYETYMQYVGTGTDLEKEYRLKLDEATAANTNAQVAVDKTSKAVNDANNELLNINATADFYEGYLAAIATGDAELIEAALTRMSTGFVTAENGTKESLERQRDNMQNYYDQLVRAMEEGNPNVTQEMLDEAKGWVDTADKELQKLETTGEHGADALGKGLRSKDGELQQKSRSLADIIKGAFEGILNGVSLGTPTATLPAYSYTAYQGKISPTRAGYFALAEGAVLPPNNPFLALVGDQKSGVNIEAPLETIKDAVRQVIGESSATSPEVIQLLQQLINAVETKDLSISERLIGETAIKQINREKRRTGVSPILD